MPHTVTPLTAVPARTRSAASTKWHDVADAAINAYPDWVECPHTIPARQVTAGQREAFRRKGDFQGRMHDGTLLVRLTDQGAAYRDIPITSYRETIPRPPLGEPIVRYADTDRVVRAMTEKLDFSDRLLFERMCTETAANVRRIRDAADRALRALEAEAESGRRFVDGYNSGRGRVTVPADFPTTVPFPFA